MCTTVIARAGKSSIVTLRPGLRVDLSVGKVIEGEAKIVKLADGAWEITYDAEATQKSQPR